MAPSIDVLVIGSGIAGVTAAIEAASNGAKVLVASAGKFLSGSSFYPGTWGLGLIGPQDDVDIDDLVDSIMDVGQGVADPVMVRAFVCDISHAIQWLEKDLGVALKRPASSNSADETAFIPCFDRKHRMWRGITRDSFETAVEDAFSRLNIAVIEHAELIDLVQGPCTPDGMPGKVLGALVYSRDKNRIETIGARSVIIATGGTSGLFERRLTSSDVLGSAHGIALAHGCKLTNIEFMQMMPGFVAPKAGLVFNEKTFRYISELGEGDARPNALDGISTGRMAELLEQRSGHGPFTSRLDDHIIDLAIDEAGEQGLRMRYEFPPAAERPEFVETFASWLQTEHGISPDDEFRVAMYAHASNGGIRIDALGRTGVPGLFACGEATGGMHGADRIGGLSSANGLVFGRRSGKCSATYAKDVEYDDTASREALESALKALTHGISIATAQKALAGLRRAMSAHCMINRSAAGLAEARLELDCISRTIENERACDATDAEISALARVTSQLSLCRAMIDAMAARTESKGAHYRADHPKDND